MNRLLFIVTFLIMIPAAAFSQGFTKAQSKPKWHKPGEAWTLSYPLGTHEANTIDTLLYNYQRNIIPEMNSDAWAGTGSYAAEGINMIYFDRPQRSQFMFEDALEHYLPSFRKEKFYNVYIPMTLLSYDFGGNRNNHTDRLSGVFAGNVNRRIGIGANIDYLYSKGSYSYQAAKNLIYGLQGYYNGDRYEMQAFINHFNSQNQENGGITDDLYIIDPARLQGGVTSIEPKSIPTRLTRAKNRLTGAEIFMSHAYKLGFWRDITEETDSVPREEFVPVTKFIYSFDYKYGHHMFTNASPTEAAGFWENTYFNPDRTEDHQHYLSVANTLGISMIEGFQTWARFGLSAYATYEIDRYKMGVIMPAAAGDADGTSAGESLTPLPAGFEFPYRHVRHRLWAGGRLEKMKGTHLRYAANARFGLIGDAAGELDIDGYLETRFKLGRDTVKISAEGFFRNTTPSWLLQHYASNHFIWDNDFGKTRSFRAGGRLYIPWTHTDIRAGVENVQNLIYFNSSSLPEQYGGSVQIFSASVEQKLKFGIWNWNNTVTYQVSSNTSVLPLPALTVYSNMFLGFTAFKVLQLQIGVDCDYYTAYNGLDYQPATMQFHVQGADPVKVGNFAFANLYATAKISKTRFFVLWSHANQNLLGRDYFSMPHYPVNPRSLRFGVSVDFAN